MRRQRNIAACLLVCLLPLWHGTLHAQAISKPKIQLQNTGALQFGAITFDDQLGAGAVTLRPNGSIQVSGAALLATAAAPAVFTVDGGVNDFYLLGADATITLTCTAGACGTATLTVSQITLQGTSLPESPCTTAVPCRTALDNQGTDTLFLGGTLNIPAGQLTGDYSGTFSFTVQYE